MADTPPDESAESEFRWTAFFQRSTEPIFVLNRRRQILFVNHAWESLTGLKGRDVYKRICKRLRDAEPSSCEAVLHALSPPREALAGEGTRLRRLIIQPESRPSWWDVEFLPLLGPNGVLGIVGKIHILNPAHPALVQPLPEKLMALRQRLVGSWSLQNLPTTVPAMRRVAEQVRLASRTSVPVLLMGEEGAGKEWLARTIHQESARREHAFFALDCRHLPAAALTWSLFGAPALARRHEATLYLKEPFCLPRELQARLCEDFSAVSDDVKAPRLLAGSTTLASAEIQSGRLLEEFHCLLSPVTIEAPPLREHLADLPWLVEKMLQRASAGRETPVTGLTEEAWEMFRTYSWPGNLSELYAVLAGACQRAKVHQLNAADLPWFLRAAGPAPGRSLPLDKILEQVERRLLQWAVAAAKGNKSRAAELLEMLRPRLLRRMEALGMKEGGEGEDRDDG